MTSMASAASTVGTLSVYAGNGNLTNSDYSPGDPCPGDAASCAATSATMEGPDLIATDAAGDLFIPDVSNQIVEEVTPNGTLSVVAGDIGGANSGVPAGSCTSDASDCLATSYTMEFAEGVAVNNSGDLFIADGGNGTIDEVNLADDHIWVIAGGGTATGSEPCGGAAGALTQSCAATGSAAGDAQLGFPDSVSVNDTTGAVYFSDSSTLTVDEVTPSGQLVVFAGNGEDPDNLPDPGPNNIGSLCISAAGQTCAADSNDNSLKSFAVNVDQETGNVYVADISTGQVLQVTPADVESAVAGCFKVCTTATQSGVAALNEGIGIPEEMQVDNNGDLYVATYGSDTAAGQIATVNFDQVDEIMPNGQLQVVAGEPGNTGLPTPGPALNSLFEQPLGIAFDPSGNLYISDYNADEVLKETFAVPTGPPAVSGPNSLTFSVTTVGRSAPNQTVTLTNQGGQSLALGNVTFGSDQYSVSPGNSSDFSITGDKCSGATLAAGASCTMQIGFSPIAAGSLSSTLVVPSNDPNAPFKIQLSGSAVQGATGSLTVSGTSGTSGPGSLQFGSVTVGQAASAQTVTVENSGSASINVGNLSLGSNQYAVAAGNSTDFSISADKCSGATLAAGASCTVQVGFTPLAAGSLSSTLVVPSNDPNSPLKVALSGTGVKATAAKSTKKASDGNQKLTLTVPSTQQCMAPTAKLMASLRSVKTTKGAKLSFVDAKFYIEPNKTAAGSTKRASSTVRLSTQTKSGKKKVNAKAGTHTLKVVVSYKESKTEKVKKDGKKVSVKKTVTVIKTLNAKFRIC